MTKIIPTVGRKVWYYSHGKQADPIDATVIKVHDDLSDSTVPAGKTPNSPVNLLVIDPDTGGSIFRPYIGCHDVSEAFPGEHFQWMPYQQAQQAKAASEAVAPAPFGIAPADSVQTSGNSLSFWSPPAIETKTYADGSGVTGIAPLPDQSPAQQDTAQALQASADVAPEGQAADETAPT